MAVTEGKRERGKKEERRRREGWTDRWRRRRGGAESRGIESRRGFDRQKARRDGGMLVMVVVVGVYLRHPLVIIYVDAF